MIGDRYLTDIVYGNRHGMLTIRPKPLTLQGEHQTVQWVRTPESSFVRMLITGTWHVKAGLGGERGGMIADNACRHGRLKTFLYGTSGNKGSR